MCEAAWPPSAIPPMSRRTEMGPVHGDGTPSPPMLNQQRKRCPCGSYVPQPAPMLSVDCGASFLLFMSVVSLAARCAIVRAALRALTSVPIEYTIAVAERRKGNFPTAALKSFKSLQGSTSPLSSVGYLAPAGGQMQQDCSKQQYTEGGKVVVQYGGKPCTTRRARRPCRLGHLHLHAFGSQLRHHLVRFKVEHL